MIGETRRTAGRSLKLIGLSAGSILLLALVSLVGLDLVSVERSESSSTPGSTHRPEMVAFIVLDNVRADRMGMCGHFRPTTPFLSEVCRDDDAFCSCRAYAPGAWTIPSHASYFTGLEVQHHQVGSPATQEERAKTELFYRTLPDSLPTLAEDMQDRGFQTVALSANPVLTEASGLLRGFEVRRVAENFRSWYSDGLVSTVRRVLDQLDPNEAPLFLFINIADAHGPWQAIPKGVGWVPPRSGMQFKEKDADDPRIRYVRGDMNEAESDELIEHFEDVYDYGVNSADRTLRRVIGLLSASGWLDGDYRIVITSDHGELIGEAGALGHGVAMFYEGLSRVPMVILSNEEGRTELAEPVSGASVFEILQGRPATRPVQAAGFDAPGWRRKYGERWGRHHGAALWKGKHKFMLVDGEFLRLDPDLESASSSSEPLSESPERQRLAEIERTLEEAKTTPLPEGTAELSKMLRALGYAD